MKQIFFFVFLGALFLVSCTRKTLPTSTEPMGTIFVESPNVGLVTLRCDGFGSNLQKAANNAVIQGFEAVLFRGIPEYTGLNRSLISSESKFKAENPNWLSNFMDSGLYERFVHKDFGSEEFATKKGKRISREFTINYKSLRNYLEEEGMIRRLGY